MFKTQQEYKSFLAWALDGSTIGQRMEVEPNNAKIPPYWERFQPIADQLPSTLQEFYADPDGASTATDPVD